MSLSLETDRLHQRVLRALAEKRYAEAEGLLQRWEELAPEDQTALALRGQLAFSIGDWPSALQALEQTARADSKNPRAWTNLAVVRQQIGDHDGFDVALSNALRADSHDVLALLMRGKASEQCGRMADAARSYGAAATVAGPTAQLPLELRGAVEHAAAFREAHDRQLAAHVDAALEGPLAALRGEGLTRFQLSLDILLGRKRRFDSQPMRYFVPQLTPTEFFERSRFPWLDSVEAGTAAIKQELTAVLSEDAQGMAPYIAYADDQPVEQWAELNHSPRWSAYHLWKDGHPVSEHVARCRATMRLLEGCPRPFQAGRTPVAMFSVLRPHTRIPPHVGASNARLVCHLPLVVPPDCGFRVGNSTRQWTEGRAWVFDDTIEHEAWNNSSQERAILIWDVWHPDLTQSERHLITAMTEALNSFSGSDDSFSA